MKNNFLYILMFLFSAVILTGCSDDDDPNPGPKPNPVENEAKEVMEKLWSTSSLSHDAKRQEAFDAIQKYADQCNSTYFNSYLKSLDAAAVYTERYTPVLTGYRTSFDKVLEEVKTTQPESGTTVMWNLYNMGYIVKTPKGTFGVDICHRYAEELEPYLDFLCVTHNHADHYDTNLINKMFANNKPVISNYLKDASYEYTTKDFKTFTIGSFNVTTNLTNHNKTTLPNFVTTFQIDCGSDGGNLVLMHVGDSNYEKDQYRIVKPVNIFIARYGQSDKADNGENQVIGNKVTPKYVILSHILELSHAGVDESRWSFELGMKRASEINCDNTILPFWGEKLVWKNGALN